jgi:hypothetical protein
MYKLRTATIGVLNGKEKRVIITVPADAVLELTGENLADGTVDVIWDSQCITMFAVDLQERGHLIARNAKRAGASTVIPNAKTAP